MWWYIKEKAGHAIRRIVQKFLVSLFTKSDDFGHFSKKCRFRNEFAHKKMADSPGTGEIFQYSKWIFCSLLLLLNSCKTPFDPTEENAGGREISIHYLKTLYNGTPLRVTEDYILRGRVVSSDEQGNFRWTLVVEDATGGIELKVGLSPYYERFPVGQEVRVKCAGLVLGAYGRTIQLGAESDNPGYETGFIAGERLGEHINPTGQKQAILPILLDAGELSMRYVDCAVRFEGLRVSDEEKGSTWGDGIGYVERHFVFDRSLTDTLAVRTSPTAVFAGEELPEGIVSLEGVLTQFAGKYSLVLNGREEIKRR